MESAALVDCHNGCHDWTPFNAKDAQQPQCLESPFYSGLALVSDNYLFASSRRVLTFHDPRHSPRMSFTTVLGVDVLQHRLSGQCAWVANVLFEVLDALRVSAGETGEDRTLFVFPNTVPHNLSVHGVRPLSV
jgi:hypothetical protein